MAYTADPWLTYESGTGDETIREELDGIIAIMSPTDTPLISKLPVHRCRNRFYEWMMDDIPYTREVQAYLEGQEVDTTAATGTPSHAFITADPRTRAGNYTMIVRRAVDVSDTQRVVDEAGITDELTYQFRRQTLAVLKQSEYNFHWSENNAGAAATPRQTHGVIPWIAWTGMEPGASTIGGHAIPNAFSGTWDSGNADDITLGEFNLMLAAAWDNGTNGMNVDGSLMFCGNKIKSVVSDFTYLHAGSGATITTSLHRNVDAHEHYATDHIDVYESQFGVIYINLDRYLNGSETVTIAANETSSSGSTSMVANETFFIIEPEFWDIQALRGLSFTPLAKTGDSSRGLIVFEAGIRCLNPAAGMGGHNHAA